MEINIYNIFFIISLLFFIIMNPMLFILFFMILSTILITEYIVHNKCKKINLELIKLKNKITSLEKHKLIVDDKKVVVNQITNVNDSVKDVDEEDGENVKDEGEDYDEEDVDEEDEGEDGEEEDVDEEDEGEEDDEEDVNEEDDEEDEDEDDEDNILFINHILHEKEDEDDDFKIL